MKNYLNKKNNLYIFFILLIIILLLHIDVLLLSANQYLSRLETADLIYFINIREYAFDKIKSLCLPLWTTKIFCGIPFLATLETAIFYLPNIIFFIFPISKAINSSFLLHFVILAFSIFLWINNKTKNKLTSLIVAIISVFSTTYYLNFYAGHLSNIITMSWFPLLLYFYDKTFERKTYIYFFPLSFIISLQIFAGHFQYTYYSALVSLIYVLFFCRSKHVFLTLIFAYFSSIFLTAVQLFPSYNFYVEGGRISGIFDTPNISIYSKIQYLLSLILYANIPLSNNLYWETSFYIGTLNFFIIIISLFSIFNKKFLKIFLIILLLYLLTFKLFSNFANNIIPFFSWFRSPIKLVFFINILLLPVLSYGIKHIILSKTKTNIFFIIFFFILSLLIIIFKDKILSFITYNHPLDKEFVNNIYFSLNTSAILIFVFSLFLYLKKHNIFKIALILLIIFEPVIVMKSYSNKTTLNRNYKYEQILKEKFNEQPRFYSYNRYNLKYNAENISGLCVDKLKNYLLFYKKQRNDNIWSLLRCKYIVDYKTGFSKNLNIQTLNKINLFYNFKTETDKDIIYEKLYNKNFNIFDTVILEKEPLFKPQKEGEYNLNILSFDENSIDFEVTTTEPAIILYADNYTKDWKAYNIENPKQKYEIICADYIYKAISVDKGYNKIRFEYKPLSFIIGMWISTIAWIIFIFFYLISIIKKKKNKLY